MLYCHIFWIKVFLKMSSTSHNSAAPPPVPKRMSMSNILHSVKRQVFGAKERTVVESFDEAKKQFDSFFEVLNTLSANVQLVSERYSLLTSSLHSTWSTISNQFEAVPDKSTFYLALMKLFKLLHIFTAKRVYKPQKHTKNIPFMTEHIANCFPNHLKQLFSVFRSLTHSIHCLQKPWDSNVGACSCREVQSNCCK